MGLIDDKKNVFTTIGAYTSLKEERDLPDSNNIFTSINNKKEIVPFLLDLLKIVVGTTALQELTGQLFTNFVDNSEPTLKASVKKQTTQYNSGNQLPDYFLNDGISVNASDIDIYGKLKTDPSGDVGSMLYDTNTDTFDYASYNAINSNGSEIQYNNLFISYNPASDKFNYRAADRSQTVGEFFDGFIDNTVFINKKEFVTNILNNIFGSTTSSQNKTVDIVSKELMVNALISQAIRGDDNFTIPQDELESIRIKAQEMIDGTVNYDMGCGLVSSRLPLSGMTALISDISGSTDPFFVGNKINNVLENSFSTTNNKDVENENKETIRNGFFDRLLQSLTIELAKILTSTPQSRMLLALLGAFNNNGEIQIGDPIEDLNRFKVYIKCVIKEAMALLNEFIFNLIVSALVSLVEPVLKKVIREKINQYVGLIKSLISSRL